jgi:hypothetical protein
MDPESASDLIETSQKYFLTTCDRDSRVWMFAEEEPGQFVRAVSPALLGASVHFGDDLFGIDIIHQFGGVQPILLNYDALTKEISIQFRPTAVMDSNVVNYLHQFVSPKTIMDSRRRNAIIDFLRFVVARPLDYNPFFYFIEGATKSREETMLGYAGAVSESILRLHTMDEKRFLSTGDIVSDQERLALYAKEYGATTIEEIAPRYARAMTHLDPHMEVLSGLAYAALLKMGLIHQSGRRGTLAKYYEMLSFMQDTLDIAMGPERILALGYFAGQYDSFIPLHRGANPDRLLKRLRTSAWDVLLLRLPALLLGMSPLSQEVVLGYVCTSDRALRQVAEVCRIEAVMALSPNSHRPLPIWSFDNSALRRMVGNDIITKIHELDTEWGKSRIPSLTETHERIPYDELLKVIDGLEAEVVRFCQS